MTKSSVILVHSWDQALFYKLEMAEIHPDKRDAPYLEAGVWSSGWS